MTFAGRVRSDPVGSQDSQRVIRAARDAVTVVLNRLRAEMVSFEERAGPHEMFPAEVSQAMLESVASGLDVSAGPIRDLIAGYPADQPLAGPYFAQLTVRTLVATVTGLTGKPDRLGDPEPAREAERLLARAEAVLSEVLDLDSFQPDPGPADGRSELPAQSPLVADPHAERVLRTAHDAVAHAGRRLRAERDWLLLHEDDLGYGGGGGPSGPEIAEAVFKSVAAGLGAAVDEVEAEWAALARRHPGTPLQLGLRHFRFTSAITGTPFGPSTLNVFESRLRRTKDCLEGSVHYLRRVAGSADPAEEAVPDPLAVNPAWVIRNAHHAVDRAVSRLYGLADLLWLAGLEETQRLAVGQPLLKGVLDALGAEVSPAILAAWGALAAEESGPDPESGRLGIALYRFHDAMTLAAGPFPEYRTRRIGDFLAQARIHLEGSVYYTRDEPRKDVIEQAERVGSAGPADWGVVVTAVVTAAAVPFLKTLMTKAAEDTYTAARTLLKRLFRNGKSAELGAESQPKLLIVKDSGAELDLALHLGVDTHDEALRKLADLDLDAVAGDAKRRKVKKLTIRWDEATRSWKSHEQ